jgi:DNA-binding NtrC family response regulator
MDRPRLLFVDDELDVVEALSRSLRRERPLWDMTFVTSAADALTELHRTPVALVVTDLRMPHMNGAELLTALKREFPKTMRCVLSGYADSELFDRALPIAHVMLTKPCEHTMLRSTIARLLGEQVLSAAA